MNGMTKQPAALSALRRVAPDCERRISPGSGPYDRHEPIQGASLPAGGHREPWQWRGAAVHPRGAPASSELATLAEEGCGDPLTALLTPQSGVLDMQPVTGTGGPVKPCEWASDDTISDFQHQNVSLRDAADQQ